MDYCWSHGRLLPSLSLVSFSTESLNFYVNNWLVDLLNYNNIPSSHTFSSSFVASLGGAVASTPLDVIRTRLMNQKRIAIPAPTLNTYPPAAPTAKIYAGTVDCLLRTVRTEGCMALYKGFIPAWLRMGPWNIIFFVTYEQLKKVY